MKKIYILCTLISLGSLTACFDLEYENFSKISSENFPQSESDLDAAIVGVYHSLGKSFIMRGMDNAGIVFTTLTTDEMNTSWGHIWEQTERFQWSANDANSNKIYPVYQQGITKATRIIDAFEKSSVEDSKKEKSIAELRALRVLYANYLYSMYGPVPIVKDAEIANDVYTEWKPQRPAKEEYYSFMVNELTEVYPLLSKEVSSDNYGRFTQGAALTLLMKIYLNDKKWEKAAETAQKVIDLKVYDLMPTYESIFHIDNENKDNVEVIFPIQRITSNIDFSWTWFACVLPATPLYKPEGASIEIWGGLKMPWAFYDKYEAGDARLNTIVRYYIDTEGEWVDYREIDHPKATGAAPMKYSEDPNQRGSYQGNDFIVFRYADVLLSRAEALNEINGPTVEAVELINKVRRRAHVDEIRATDFTKDSLRDFILDERGRELYCEGHRRDDLIRHGKYIEKVREKGFTAHDYHVLFPIPQDVMNENSNLNQNTGY
ncbi:MAG: RagB/SusD family nutrient uptake outer membrane protein [Tannerellaceae bacterium]|nr:RagB/SusD family nutrient uptake outer membrane protein [Tannerellaceae bacterium]